MRRIDHLITLARMRTRSTDYSATRGIQQELFLEWANDAQDHLQSIIASVYSSLFRTEKIISLVGDTESYTIPDRLLGDTRIVSVEYSNESSLLTYSPLVQTIQRDRNTISGVPTQYILRDGAILLNAIPSATQGAIRVNYYRELDDLDISRGTVNGTPANAVIATTGLDITSLPTNITNADYICINDKWGNCMLRNGLVSSWLSPNITLAANVSTYLVGSYTLANLANGFITFGAYSTTHSKLPDICERYIKVWMQKRAMSHGESNSSMEEDGELKTIELDILNQYADETNDIREIPIIDEESYR